MAGVAKRSGFLDRLVIAIGFQSQDSDLAVPVPPYLWNADAGIYLETLDQAAGDLNFNGQVRCPDVAGSQRLTPTIRRACSIQKHRSGSKPRFFSSRSNALIAAGSVCNTRNLHIESQQHTKDVSQMRLARR